MVRFHSVDPLDLAQFLERRRSAADFPQEMSLADNLIAILKKANEFVPSQAGSLLLDNPIDKLVDPTSNRLTFISTFGERSERIVGHQISAETGIAGYVYRTGESYRSHNLHDDQHFYAELDLQTEYRTESIIAIPVRIEREVCGVLELINRHERSHFSREDQTLLEIFAGYISTSIQNVIDGRAAQEIAKRDNLTGLFNDRYLHLALSQAIADCRRETRDMALCFLDLDYFKRVNDTHGHLSGSQVLREVGRLLRKTAQYPGAIAARYGGDEFVIAVPGMNLSEGVELAETIRANICSSTFCSEPGEVQPEPLHLNGITCSIGVASLRRHIEDGIDVEPSKSALLRHADTAMYIAKETGRNRTVIAGEPVRQPVTNPAPPPSSEG